jgi:hypothetical protein
MRHRDEQRTRRRNEEDDVISNDQGQVTKRAREATPDDLKKDEEMTPAELEAERLQTLARSDKPLSELTPAEILAMPLPHFRTSEKGWERLWDREKAIKSLKARLEDELAYARVLARQGELPEGDWKAEDPRRQEWRKACWALARAAVEQVKDMDDERPTLDSPAFQKLAEVFEEANGALTLLRSEDDAIRGR